MPLGRRFRSGGGEIIMCVPGAARVERAPATRAGRGSAQIFVGRHLITAAAAEDDAPVEFILLPDFGRMWRDFMMAEMTGEPLSAAFEFQGHNIAFAVVMRAACLGINSDAVNFETVNCSRHLDAALVRNAGPNLFFAGWLQR